MPRMVSQETRTEQARNSSDRYLNRLLVAITSTGNELFRVHWLSAEAEQQDNSLHSGYIDKQTNKQTLGRECCISGEGILHKAGG